MNSPIRLSRFARGDSRRIEVSFEFFPPNTEEMDKILWEFDRTSGAAGAEFRLGHLWGRRHHARAHPLDGQTNSDRNAADAGRSSHVRRCHARGHRPDRAHLS